MPPARVHEHGRHPRRRRARPTSPPSDSLVHFEHLFGHYKRSKYLAEHEVLRARRDAAFPVVLVHPTFPVGEGDSAPTPTGRTIVEFLNGRIPGLRRHRAQRRARRRRRPRPRARRGTRRARPQLHPRRREHVAAARCSRRSPTSAGLPAPASGSSPASCCRSCAAPSGSEATVLRREPTLPSEPVRMATTRMEYDDSRARTELGYTSMPGPRRAGARGALVRRARLRQGSAGAIAVAERRRHRRSRPGAIRRIEQSTSARRRAEDATRADVTTPLRPRALLARARARSVRAARALHESADATRPAHDRLRRDYVRAEGAYLFDRDGRALPRLPRRVRRVRARALPSRRSSRRSATRWPARCRTSCRWSASRSRVCSPKRSSRACPNDDYRCFFTNSGAESVETVLKFARCATGTVAASCSPTTRSTASPRARCR